MPDDFPTTCPFCGHRHDAITSVVREDAFPDDGDITLCFSCGRIAVIDSKAKGGMRQPTKKEQRYISRNDMAVKLVAAWNATPEDTMTQTAVTALFIIVMVLNVVALARHFMMMRALEIALNGMIHAQRDFDEMMKREKINSPPLDPSAAGTSSV